MDGIFAMVLTGLAAAGVLYQLVALVLVLRFFAPRAQPGEDMVPGGVRAAAVSVLKPLHGAEPRLFDNLASFLDAAHDGPLQLVCGVNEPADGAVPIVAALRAARPQADIALGTGPRAPGANGKIGNCIAMLPQARHEVLVLSDSDISVPADYWAAVLAALDRPGVGAVTCLYTARGDAGLWSELGAAAIAYSTMPAMVVGLVTGLAQPCTGATIALRRETLRAIGGFERFAQTLADDHAIGRAVRDQGLAVAVPPLLVVHAGAERSPGELWRHHLRWMVTLRSLAGAGHYGSVVTHALPLALLAAVFRPSAGLVLAAAALCARLALAVTVDRIDGRRSARLWLLPLADGIEFVIFCASLAARRIDWRGTSLTMARGGRITA